MNGENIPPKDRTGAPTPPTGLPAEAATKEGKPRKKGGAGVLIAVIIIIILIILGITLGKKAPKAPPTADEISEALGAPDELQAITEGLEAINLGDLDIDLSELQSL